MELHWQRWNKTCHLGEKDRVSGTIVKRNSIGLIGLDTIRRRDIQRKWDVHDCNRQEHICGGIQLFHLSAGRVLLLHDWVVVAEEVDKQTAIMPNVRIYQAWKVILIKPITIGFVVLFVVGVINHEGI
jgi:hypothetical protein